MPTEDDLRTAFTALECHAPAAARVLPGSKRRTRHSMRSPRAIRWAAGLATTAALAGVVTALTLPSRAPGSIPNGGVASSAPISKAALQAKLLAAFSAASGEILYGYDTVGQLPGDPPVVQESWHYPWQANVGQHVRNRTVTTMGGKPFADAELIYQMPAPHASRMSGTSELIDVSYAHRTWLDLKMPGLGLASGDPDNPTFLLNQIKAGAYTVTDTTLDGRTAIELSWPAPAGTGHLWVDAHSYLPLREADTYQATSGGKKITLGAQTDYQLLPATPANLAKLNTPIPPGFKQLVEPQGGTEIPAPF